MENKLILKLNEEFQKIHTRINKDIDSYEHLYHYTNYEGLKGILKQRKLRYTDYKYFNDPTEIRHGIRIVKELLLLKHPLILDFYPFIPMLFDELGDDFNVYVACFSKEIKKLALWRYYAHNGSGFAIGFNEKFCSTSNMTEKVDSKNTQVKQVKAEVRYGKEAEDVIDESLGVFEKFSYEASRDQPKSKDLPNQSLHLLFAHLISLLPILKDKSFNDEDEVRFFCCEGKLMLDPHTGKSPYFFDDQYREFIPTHFKENLPFVHQQHGKIPVILPHEFSHSDISEIWIGPCCEFLEARAAIRKLLCENGFNLDDIRIEKVLLPYQHR